MEWYFFFNLYGYAFFYECPIGNKLYNVCIKLLHLNNIKKK
jgi:hypothetical protein